MGAPGLGFFAIRVHDSAAWEGKPLELFTTRCVRGEQSGEQIVPNKAMFTHFWCSQSDCKLLMRLRAE